MARSSEPDSRPLLPGAEALEAGGAEGIAARRVAGGEPVFEPGDEAASVFVIQSGEVELLRPGPDGPRLLGRLGPGALFGEQDLLLRRARTVRAVAVCETAVIELDRETFERMCLERPEIAVRILERMADRVAHLEERLGELGVPDLLRPVIRALLRHARPADGELRAETTLRDLAREAGLSLWECHRALERLFQQRLLRLGETGLAVRDPDALAAILDA